MRNNEEHIRELAYYLWVSEGKPDGQSSRHWEMASQMATENDKKNNANKTGKFKQKRSVDPSEEKGPTEPEQPDQT